MPLIKSAIKRAKQALVHKERNQATKRDIKAAVKAFDAAPSASTLSQAQSAIDTAVKKNILEKRTAARRKSALSRRAKAAGVKLATGTKKSTPKAVSKPVATTAAKAPAKAVAPKTTKPAVKKPAAKKPVAKKPAAKKLLLMPFKKWFANILMCLTKDCYTKQEKEKLYKHVKLLCIWQKHLQKIL